MALPHIESFKRAFQSIKDERRSKDRAAFKLTGDRWRIWIGRDNEGDAAPFERCNEFHAAFNGEFYDGGVQSQAIRFYDGHGIRGFPSPPGHSAAERSQHPLQHQSTQRIIVDHKDTAAGQISHTLIPSHGVDRKRAAAGDASPLERELEGAPVQ